MTELSETVTDHHITRPNPFNSEVYMKPEQEKQSLQIYEFTGARGFFIWTSGQQKIVCRFY